MEFIDYYDLLKLARTVTEKEIKDAFTHQVNLETSVARYNLLCEGYAVLVNPYRRARYDKTVGHIMTIQAKKAEIKRGSGYQLAQIVQPYLALQSFKDMFRAWVLRKTGNTWDEAQEENYHYRLSFDNENPKLILCAPREEDLNSFAKELLEAKKIKPMVLD